MTDDDRTPEPLRPNGIRLPVGGGPPVHIPSLVAAGYRELLLDLTEWVDALVARRSALARWQYDGCFASELVTSSSGVSCGWFEPVSPGAAEGALVEAGMSRAFTAESLVVE